jgi:hypothetical protein
MYYIRYDWPNEEKGWLAHSLREGRWEYNDDSSKAFAFRDPERIIEVVRQMNAQSDGPGGWTVVSELN